MNRGGRATRRPTLDCGGNTKSQIFFVGHGGIGLTQRQIKDFGDKAKIDWSTKAKFECRSLPGFAGFRCRFLRSVLRFFRVGTDSAAPEAGGDFCRPLRALVDLARWRPDAAVATLAEAAAFWIFFTLSLELFSYFSMAQALPLRDSVIAAADQALGFDFRAHLAFIAARRRFARVLEFAYDTSILQIAVTVIALTATRRLARLYRALCGDGDRRYRHRRACARAGRVGKGLPGGIAFTHFCILPSRSCELMVRPRSRPRSAA
jgi:hypothetical protein